MIVDENRHRLLVKPCLDTLGRIAVLIDSYKNPSTNALNIVRFESSYSKKIPITYWISSHSTHIRYHNWLTPRLQSPILSQAATEDPSWLLKMAKSFPITGLGPAVEERQDIDIWFSKRTSRHESLQLSLLVRALLILMEKDPKN